MDGVAEPDPAELIRLAEDVYVWTPQRPGHGRTNVGVVVEADGLTLVDTTASTVRSAPLAEALARFERPLRRVVYSSSHVEYTGGSATFWMAARYGRSQTSALLDQPPNPEAWRRLHPELAEEFTDLVTRPVSHTVDTAAWLTETVCLIPTGGQQLENLALSVPGAEILFAGAMACFGVTPNAFDGDPLAWADALDELSEVAGRVVPGIGPAGGADEVLALQAYLWAVAEADGDPAAIPAGPWDDWPDRHLDAVNVERAAMLAAGDRSVPPSMLALLGLS